MFREKRKWKSRRAGGGFLFILAGLSFLTLDDQPVPAVPATPFLAASPDTPDVEDYELTREKRYSLLPPLEVVITGYSSTPEQTDETPFLTASMTKVRPGVIALSRDLIRRYNPAAPFRYGDRVRVEGIGEFVVEDTMNRRYRRRADIWFETIDEAVRWGAKKLEISTVSDAGGGATGSGRIIVSAPSG